MKVIPLTQGHVALVDDEDYTLVSKWRWKILKANGLLYAARTDKRLRSHRTVLMHRLIANAPPGAIIDHRDHNGLNNQRDNLRVTTQGMNRANSRKTTGTSKFKGVYRHSRNGTWIAQIKSKYKTRYLGSFQSERAAADAYNKAAKEAFGEFAWTNV